MRRLVSVWGPAVAVMASIFFMSSLSDPGIDQVPVSDKTLHVLAYSILGLCLLRARSGARWRAVNRHTVAWVAAVGAIYGASDELHQSLVPGRIAAVDDWVADVVGVCLGASIGWIVATARARSGRGRAV